MEDQQVTSHIRLSHTVDLHSYKDRLSTCGTRPESDDTQLLKRS